MDNFNRRVKLDGFRRKAARVELKDGRNQFMALLAGHIPSPYESLVYYYGIYSSSYRGKEKRENTEKNTEKDLEVEEVRGTGKASSTWARLIRNFEVDPLCCKRCGGEMKIIAFITKHSETRKILKHIKEETVRPPPPVPAFFQALAQEKWFADYIPPLEDYIRDTDDELNNRCYFLTGEVRLHSCNSSPVSQFTKKNSINFKKPFHLFHQILKKLPLRPEISLDITKMEVL